MYKNFFIQQNFSQIIFVKKTKNISQIKQPQVIPSRRLISLRLYTVRQDVSRVGQQVPTNINGEAQDRSISKIISMRLNYDLI